MRLTLQNLSNTRIPQVIGKCATDLTAIASYANEAIQRLIQDRAFGETGPWGTSRRVVFNVDPADPYITQPREIARLENLDVCKSPVSIANEWYEVMEAGPGLQTNDTCCELAWNWGWYGLFGYGSCYSGTAVFDRGTVSSAYELTASNKKLRVYVTDSRDIGRRILISGATDQNGSRVYTQDGLNAVDGFYLTMDSPFATSSFIVTGWQGIIKDATFGDVLLKEVDATTGVERLLGRYAPSETNPSYRRYFFKNLPKTPVSPATTPATYKPIQVTAMAKLEFIPVVRATDFLLIGNIPALKEEFESIRYSEMDNTAAQQMSILKHKNAVRLLRNELIHYLGNQTPAITMAIAGLEGMREQRIGSMI